MMIAFCYYVVGSRPHAASYMEKDDANENLPPRRNMSAFFHFGNDLRKQLMADDPSLTFTTVVPVISSKWKEADEKTKADYEEKARLDKERYLKQKKEYDKRMEAKATRGTKRSLDDAYDGQIFYKSLTGTTKE